MRSLRAYALLSKPGILFGNAVTALGGFALASQGSFDPRLFLMTFVGLSLIIASACTFNNYIDRASDQKMLRTQSRVLVTGEITPGQALVFALLTVAFGSMILGFFVNSLALMIALCGFAVYVFAYSLLKYKTPQATLIGSIAGAAPPVIGYCAVSNSLDLGAWLLFALVALWQMPHFFAIALYRLEDYAAAEIPVLPLVKGAKATKVQMMLYIAAFTGVCLLFPLLGYTGQPFLFVAAGLGCIWLLLSLWGFSSRNDKKWARAMFLFSLVAITLLSISFFLQ